jgi:hypothetical protein
MRRVTIDLVAGQGAELEEVRVAIEEQLHALPGQQLAALLVALGVLRPAAFERLRERRVHRLQQLEVLLSVRVEGRPPELDVRLQHRVRLLVDAHGADVANGRARRQALIDSRINDGDWPPRRWARQNAVLGE